MRGHINTNRMGKVVLTDKILLEAPESVLSRFFSLFIPVGAYQQDFYYATAFNVTNKNLPEVKEGQLIPEYMVVCYQDEIEPGHYGLTWIGVQTPQGIVR